MSESSIDFNRVACPECNGTKELRIESESINENFEVERQTLITECPVCMGLGFRPQAKT